MGKERKGKEITPQDKNRSKRKKSEITLKKKGKRNDTTGKNISKKLKV